MEARIARLESDVAHLRSDVAEIKIDVRALRDRMDTRIDRLEFKLDSLTPSSTASSPGEYRCNSPSLPACSAQWRAVSGGCRFR